MFLLSGEHVAAIRRGEHRWSRAKHESEGCRREFGRGEGGGERGGERGGADGERERERESK